MTGGRDFGVPRPFRVTTQGRRGLGSELRGITCNSTGARDVLGYTTTRVTEQHYEHLLPEEALRGMKQLEAKARTN